MTHQILNGSSHRVVTIEENVQNLREQVNQLSAALKQVQGEVYHLNRVADRNEDCRRDVQAEPSAATGRGRTSLTRPHFVGPTSSAYNFNVANTTLQSMGIGANKQDARLDSTLTSRRESPEPPTREDESAQDPLLSIDISEIYRTLEIYREDMMPIYPFVNFDEIIHRVPKIHEYLQKALAPTLTRRGRHDPVDDDRKDSNIIKLMVASALLLEGGGQSNLGQQLVDSVEAGLARSVRNVEVNLKELQILTMTVRSHP